MPRTITGPAVVEQYIPVTVAFFRFKILQKRIQAGQSGARLRPAESGDQPPPPLFRSEEPRCENGMPIRGSPGMQQEPVGMTGLPGIVEIALTARPFIPESAGMNVRPLVEQPYPLAVGDRGRI